MCTPALTGQIDAVVDDDAEACAYLRRAFGYLPANPWEEAPVVRGGDPADRLEPRLRSIVPEDPARGFDVKRVIELVVDVGSFLEWKPEFGRNLVCGLARLDGHTDRGDREPTAASRGIDGRRGVDQDPPHARRLRHVPPAAGVVHRRAGRAADAGAGAPAPARSHLRARGRSPARARAQDQRLPAQGVRLRAVGDERRRSRSGTRSPGRRRRSRSWVPSPECGWRCGASGRRARSRRFPREPRRASCARRRGRGPPPSAPTSTTSSIPRRRGRSWRGRCASRARGWRRRARGSDRLDATSEQPARRQNDDGLGRRAAPPRRGSRSVPRVRRGASARQRTDCRRASASTSCSTPARSSRSALARAVRSASAAGERHGGDGRGARRRHRGGLRNRGRPGRRRGRRGRGGAGLDRRRSGQEQGPARDEPRLSGRAADRLSRRRSGGAERSQRAARRWPARSLLGPPAGGARSPSRAAREPAGDGRARAVAARVAAARRQRRPRRQAPRRAAGAVRRASTTMAPTSRSAPTRKRSPSCCAS